MIQIEEFKNKKEANIWLEKMGEKIKILDIKYSTALACYREDFKNKFKSITSLLIVYKIEGGLI